MSGKGLAAKRIAINLPILLASAYTAYLFASAPWVEELESQSLAFHMLVEHTAFLAAGMLATYALDKLWMPLASIVPSRQAQGLLVRAYAAALRFNHRVNRHGVPAIVAVAFIFGFWHNPTYFDLVEYDALAHALMHLSFMAAGSLMYAAAKVIPTILSLALLVGLAKVMGISSFLILAGNIHLYQSYSLEENISAAYYMAIAMIPIDLAAIPAILYLVFQRIRDAGRVKAPKPLPWAEGLPLLERKVRRFQDAGVIAAVLTHLMLVVNAVVLVKLLGMPLYAVMAFHLALQAATILWATVAPQFYRRYLLGRLSVTLRKGY